MQQQSPGVPVLFALMGANALVYALWHTWGIDHVDFMRDQFLVSVPAVFSGRVWTLLTSTFSHVDPMHLLFNMIALYVFGKPVYRVIGGKRFLLLYLLGGLAGSIGHVVFSLVTGSSVGALGASGAVMAVAVPYAMWFPKQTLLINFFIPVPAWLAVLLFIVSDTMGLFGASLFGEDSVAHAAHLGGALVGLVLGVWRLLLRRT